MLGKVMLTIGIVANLVAVAAAEGCDPDQGGKAKKMQIAVYSTDGRHRVDDYHGSIKADKPTRKCTWETLVINSHGKFRRIASGTEMKRRASLAEPATHFRTSGCGRWTRVK